jgi:hypothetical protein
MTRLGRLWLTDFRCYEHVELELIRHRGASAVAAVDADGRVVLIRQYRYAAGGYIWELPAGILNDANEAPAASPAPDRASMLRDKLLPPPVAAPPTATRTPCRTAPASTRSRRVQAKRRLLQ